jgi:hypothetical protein
MAAAVYAVTVQTFVSMLGSLSQILDKAAADPKAGQLVEARLAPDMFPLSVQIKLACDFALKGACLLADQPPPASDDPGATLADLRAFIAATITALQAMPESRFDGASARTFTIPLQGDMVLELDGLAVARDWTLPNFYFHVVTAYDILRHEGLQIGKQDYLAHIGPMIRTPAA